MYNTIFVLGREGGECTQISISYSSRGCSFLHSTARPATAFELSEKLHSQLIPSGLVIFAVL